MNKTIPIYKIKMPIKDTTGALSICGDFHYGIKNITKEDIITNLNNITDKYKDNLFRIITGDMVENQLKTSVGHNYDVALADPAVQKEHMIDILQETNKYLYGSKWKSCSKVNSNNNSNNYTDIRSIGVEGNHEYRTRKVSGQWLSREIYTPARILDGGFRCIIELTIHNKRLKNIQKTYKIFLAHRLSSSNTSSPVSLLRKFKETQASLPGIDLFIIGHHHNKFIYPDSYFDVTTGNLKKVFYIVNPSPMGLTEYAEEAGYKPTPSSYSCEIMLPLDEMKQLWTII